MTMIRSLGSLWLCVASLSVAIAADGPAAEAKTEAPCRAVAGLDELVRAGKVILLGELHGTAESPAFALNVACHGARADLPVIVGLELSPDEQARVDAYLGSTGGEADREAVLSGTIWQREYQDGRNSRAMFELIEGLRALRREGNAVRVVLFDAGGGGGKSRDQRMAENLARAIGPASDSLSVILAGNLHTRVVASPRYEPMGHALGKKIETERLVALDAAYANGSAWVCTPSDGCGAFGLKGRGPRSNGITMGSDAAAIGHHGWYWIGPISASLPAARASSPTAER